LERIEAVISKDLDNLEKALLTLRAHSPRYAEADKHSAYMQGYKDAAEAALAMVRERKI